jgi:hypothetical protein
VRGPVGVGLAGNGLDVEAPAHLAAQRHRLAREPARPPLDGSELTREKARAGRSPPRVGQRGCEPARLPDETCRGRERFGGHRSAQRGVDRGRVDERGHQPPQAQAEGDVGAGDVGHGTSRGAGCGVGNRAGRHHLRTVPADRPRSAAITRSTTGKRFASERVKCGHGASGYGIGRIK